MLKYHEEIIRSLLNLIVIYLVEKIGFYFFKLLILLVLQRENKVQRIYMCI
jgi:hypothetical protein